MTPGEEPIGRCDVRSFGYGDLDMAPVQALIGELFVEAREWVGGRAAVRVDLAGRTAHLRAGKGTRILAELLRRPRTHVHATALDGRDIQQADLGPALDDVAKRAYRRRLSELETWIDSSVLDGEDPTPLVAEREAIVDELARAAGLRGRARTLGSDSEKARVNVTKALAAVLRTLDKEHPDAAAHLRTAIRTGRSCAYVPDPTSRIVWTVRASA